MYVKFGVVLYYIVRAVHMHGKSPYCCFAMDRIMQPVLFQPQTIETFMYLITAKLVLKYSVNLLTLLSPCYQRHSR